MGPRGSLLLRVSGVLLVFFGGCVPAGADVFLVAPFESSTPPSGAEWVGESFSEALSARLVGSGHLPLAREERLEGLERLGLPASGALTRASWLRLGEELEADRVVLGWFGVEDDQLTARAQLLDVRRLTLSPLLEEKGPFAQLLEVQTRLAWEILRYLDPSFPLSQQAFRQRFPPSPLSAFESYVRGLLATSREQQLRYFLQAARSDPGYSPPAFWLARLYFDDQDYAAAARWFARIPSDDPLALNAQFYLSLCYFFSGDLARATEALEPLGDRLPVKEVWNNLGVFASRRDLHPAALGYFNRALEADFADPDLYFNLGLHHLQRGEWQDAVRALAECVALNSNDTEAHFLRAHAFEKMGRQQEAERARQQAVGDNPALALSLERRQLDFDRLQLQLAPHRARQLPGGSSTASTRAQHVGVHVARGEHLLASGRIEEARQEFTEAILLDPDSERAHFLLAEIYQRLGRLPEAVSEFKAALWSQETVSARLRLAELYLVQNRPAQAREQVRAALALDPANAAARALEAQLASGPGTPEEKPQ